MRSLRPWRQELLSEDWLREQEACHWPKLTALLSQKLFQPLQPESIQANTFTAGRDVVAALFGFKLYM